MRHHGENSEVKLLESNFDKALDKLMIECTAWKKLAQIGVVIPPKFEDFTKQYKENLRIYKEHVMVVVRN